MERITTTLPRLLVEKSALLKDRVAMRQKAKGIWQQISWSEYLEHVRCLALGLRHLGLQPQECVSILGENCPEWIFSDLATQCNRGITVGIYPTNSAEQVHYICDNSQSKFIIVEDQEQADKVLEIRDRLPGLQRVIVIDMKGLRGYDDPALISYAEVEAMGRRIDCQEPQAFDGLVAATAPEDAAFIVYTSGTTGHPKGAVLTHRNHLHGILYGMQPILRFSDRDSILSYLPLCHILERAVSMSMPLAFGYTISFAESIDTVPANIQEIRPTFFAAVPRILEKMHSGIQLKLEDTTWLKRNVYRLWQPVGRRAAAFRLQGRHMPPWLLGAYGLGYLCVFRAVRDKLGMLKTRCLMSGGAPIAPEVLDFYRSMGVHTIEMYAMTECGAISGPKETIKPGSVGEPCASLDFKLGDDNEIMVRGDAVFAGYYRDPQATGEVVHDGWLHTGDVGELDADGHLYIVDRKKDIIITSGGKNISPSEIENKIKCSPYIKEAVVIGDGRKFLSALLQIDYENVGNWAQKNKIAYTNYKSLAASQAVFELIETEVRTANDAFARVENIRKFHIMEKEFDQDDEELTATQKVKRKVIAEKFKAEIDAMYISRAQAS